MSGQKGQYLVFIAIAVVVLAGVSSLWGISAERFSAQAGSDVSPLSPVNQTNSLTIEQTQWLTDTFDFPGDVSVAGTQAATLSDLGRATLSGAISTMNHISATYVSPAAFHQASNSSTTSSPANGFRFWPEGGYIYNTSATTMTLIAPVHLPAGATLTKFSMVLFDNDAINDVTAVLYRKNLVSSPASSYAELIIGVSKPLYDPHQVFLVYNSTFVGSTTVSNECGYYVVFKFAPNTDTNQLVFGFSVDYDPPAGPGSGVEVVPMAAFRHDGSNANAPRFDFNVGFVRNTSASPICLMAPTYPPSGATLTEFRASIADKSDLSDLSVRLRRAVVDQGVPSHDELAVVISDGTSAAFNNGELSSTLSISVTEGYSHYVTLCFDADTGNDIYLFGARLFYTQ